MQSDFEIFKQKKLNKVPLDETKKKYHAHMRKQTTITLQGITYISRTFWVLHKNTVYLVFFFENFPKTIIAQCTTIRDCRVIMTVVLYTAPSKGYA